MLPRALHPEVLQAEPAEVLVPVRGPASLLAQPNRVVERLVARTSAEAAEHRSQQLFGRKRETLAGFEVQLELFGADGVELGVDVDEEELQAFFDLVLCLFDLLVDPHRPLPLQFSLVFVERHVVFFFVSALHSTWFKSSKSDAFICELLMVKRKKR